MEVLSLNEIAAATGGKASCDAKVNSVCIDTRKITPGCLYICIKGARFDGHSFADNAFELGAKAVMISSDISVAGPYVKVEDTSKALLELAGYYRTKFDIPVVGLTGSVGKTTTKEFTYLALSSKYRTIKTQGNLNNEIGMPQTLFTIDGKSEAAVIEMGMNHFGEIKRLSKACKPTVGLITNIGVSHIENLGSRQGILKAKLEITNGLKKGAPLILNGDNDLLSSVKLDDFKIYFFGIENKNADFVAEDIKEENNTVSFDICFFGKRQRVTLPVIGIHNVYNALAAFAVGYFLDVDPAAASQALIHYQPEGMRQKSVTVGGILSVEDCYNASPDSMKAALKTLGSIKKGKKIAVLGDMLELGDYSKEAHRLVGKEAAENKIDCVLTYGSDAKYISQSAIENGIETAFHFDKKEELSKKLVEIAKPGDAVLFKASRGMKLEQVIREAYDRWENK